MIEVIAEISEQRLQTPWIADHYRLLFLTADLPSPWGEWLASGEALRLFNFLLHLGEKGSLLWEEGLHCWHKLANESEVNFSKQSSRLFLTELVIRKIIDQTPYPFSSKEARPTAPGKALGSFSYLQLCPLGFELTAEAFACKHQGNLFKPTELSRLNPAWQTAYLQKLEPKHKDYIKELLGQGMRLHPDAIAVAVDKLSCNSNIDELFGDLVKITKSAVPAIRAAACQSLSRLNGKTLETANHDEALATTHASQARIFAERKSQINEILGDIAIHDGSALVRSIALDELRQILPHSALTLYRQSPLATGKIA